MNKKIISWVSFPLLLWLLCSIPINIALDGRLVWQLVVIAPGLFGLLLSLGNEIIEYAKNPTKR